MAKLAATLHGYIIPLCIHTTHDISTWIQPTHLCVYITHDISTWIQQHTQTTNIMLDISTRYIHVRKLSCYIECDISMGSKSLTRSCDINHRLLGVIYLGPKKKSLLLKHAHVVFNGAQSHVINQQHYSSKNDACASIDV